MTNDKALEAARECPWHGDNSNLTVEDNGVGCFWVVCGKNNCGCEGPYASSPEEAIAAWNRRAPLSALPGEAEVIWTSTSAMRVLKDHYPLVEVLPAHLQPTDRHTFGLVTLASFQAMQARAEAAERERGYWQKLHDERTAFLGQCATEKEAAEARVKEMEGQLENWQRATERYYDVTTEYFSDTAFDADGTLADADAAIYVLLDELRRARTALKGGSNG